MSDVRIFVTTDGAEINVSGGEVELDRGLTTAVVLSLDTDTSKDFGPGYWGDTIREDGRVTGSRLYLLKKNTNDDRLKGVQYIKEALAWMIEDEIVESVVVSFTSTLTTVTYKIVIKEPGKEQDTIFKYEQNWAGEKAKIDREAI